jgi:hypothetical protein
VVRPDLEVGLLDCPFVERDWPARIGRDVAVNRAMARAFDRNFRLEVILVSSDRISRLLFYFSESFMYSIGTHR